MIVLRGLIGSRSSDGEAFHDQTRQFFAKLVRLGRASIYDCRHNRARIYHVNQRALYTNALMPIVPIVGVGLWPVAQLVVLPVLAV